MKRINGFVEFNELLNVDLETLIERGIVEDFSLNMSKRLVIKIGEKKFVFKECSYVEAITELIVNEMLDIAKRPNIKYDLIHIGDYYGVISKDFNKKGYKYYSGEDLFEDYIKKLPKEADNSKDKEFRSFLLEEYERFSAPFRDKKNNLELIWQVLEDHFREYDNKNEIVRKLMQQLCINHICDMLIYNQDRNSSNWIIEESENDANLVPAFDHGETFKKEYFFTGIIVDPINKKKYETPRIYTEVERFLKRSDKRYYEIFLELKDRLGMDTLKKAIKKVERKIKEPIKDVTKNEIIATFLEHQNNLNIVLEKLTQYQGR